MDRLTIRNRPLHIRSGHTPVSLGLLLGSLVAAIPALVTASTRSAAVANVLGLPALMVFYVILLLSAGLALSAVYHQLPDVLTDETYALIVSRLVRERIGLYGVAGVLLIFSIAALTSSGWNGLSAASWLVGVGGGLVFRARQTHQDVEKLHRARDFGDTVSGELLADPDGET